MVVKNALVLSVTQLVVRLLSALWLFVAARYLGAAEFGLVSTAMATADIITVVSDFGIGPNLVKRLSSGAKGVSDWLDSAATLKLILGLVALLLTWLGLLAVQGPSKLLLLVLVAALVFRVPHQIMSVVAQARQRMTYNAGLTLVSRVSSLVLGYALLARGLGAAGVVWAQFATTAVICLLAAWVLRVAFQVRLRMRWELSFFRELMREGAPFLVSSLLAMVYFRQDLLMVTGIHGEVEAGYYSAAYKLIDVVIGFSTHISASVFPEMAALAENRERFSNFVRKAFGAILLLALPMAVGTFAVAEALIQVIYGSEFAPSVMPLRALAWAIPLIFLNGVLNHAHISLGRSWLLLYSSIACVAINAVVNFALIPHWGSFGAAVATVFTEMVLFSVNLWYLGRRGEVSFDLRRLVIIVASSTVMGLAVGKLAGSSLVAGVPLGVLVYGALLLLAGINPVRELRKSLHDR